MDWSLPGSSVHGIFQARILEWVAISFSRGFSQPRDQTLVSCIAGRSLHDANVQDKVEKRREKNVNLSYIKSLFLLDYIPITPHMDYHVKFRNQI